MHAPLISIITPTYNRAEFLKEALQSVLAQSYENWELIVVDDGSTDNTAQVVEGIAEPRIKYLHQNNQQAAAARNRGMAEANGHYFCFLDDDDRIAPGHLLQLIEALATGEEPSLVYRVGQLAQTPDGDARTKLWDNDGDALAQFWEQPTGAFCYFFATDKIRKIEWTNHLLLLEDFKWMNEVLRHHDCHQLPEYTAIVRRHPRQRSSTYLTDDLLQQNIATLAECYNQPGVSERVDFELYRKQVLHQYLHYTRQLGREGKRIKAAMLLKKASTYATPEEWKELGRTFAKLVIG